MRLLATSGCSRKTRRLRVGKRANGFYVTATLRKPQELVYQSRWPSAPRMNDQGAATAVENFTCDHAIWES